MNLFCRKILRELLLPFPSSSSSSRNYLLLMLGQRQHPVAVLQRHSFLYSTTTTSSARSLSNNHKDERYTSENPKPLEPPVMVQKQTQEPQIVIEMEEGLKKKEQLPNADWPKPSEIPWQSKVANSVNLIGHVKIPVQFEASPDGKYWAGTIISQNDRNSFDTPPFWIPVIFEGDMAHMAACHLKVKDRVHIAGQLSAYPPPFTMGHGEANVQVMVHSINFVQGSSQTKQVVTPPNLWGGGTVADDGDPAFQSWRDLVRNPIEWWDNREYKLKGSLKPNHPDFKHKDSGLALWLDRAPKWVWSQLEGLEFAAQLPKVKQGKSYKGDDSWKKLVEDPDKWWDNRADKIKEKSPDFKHKVTGEALWLSDSPAWVLYRLPPLKAKRTAIFTKRDEPLSDDM